MFVFIWEREDNRIKEVLHHFKEIINMTAKQTPMFVLGFKKGGPLFSFNSVPVCFQSVIQSFINAFLFTHAALLL